MPEAEDVIVDAARHATIYARDLWRRHRKSAPQDGLRLRDVSQRLDLLISAVFGTSYTIRVAQPPAPPSFLSKVFLRRQGPRVQSAIPATDGISIWLPMRLDMRDQSNVLECFRVLALQQAMRAHRGSAGLLGEFGNALERSVFTVLEARATDDALERILPGMQPALHMLRATALRRRPALAAFPVYRRSLEELVRRLMADTPSMHIPDTAAEAAAMARSLAAEIPHGQSDSLYKDWWTGELRAPAPQAILSASGHDEHDQSTEATRSARLPRSPEVREPEEDEDDDRQGAWMVQTSEPHEQAEDPVGMQRPTDRDEDSAAEELADAVSELPEARLVSSPSRPKEVLLSDDTPASRAKRASAVLAREAQLQYPEWDCKLGAYREPGATVHLSTAQEGQQEWVERTIAAHRAMLELVRRRFEMLRARRIRLRKQLEGEEIDLQACIDSYADFRAGLPMTQALYETCRPAKRDMAIMLLIDISGSTDGWISAHKRVIDVEREALLLVCIALQGLGEPYSVLAFSGEGPQRVTVRTVKSFEERFSDAIGRRIGALEPDAYTRAGAAIRHATATLMRQAAQHRLLLLLSDGKPNDMDEYEGRYGVEDMRQSVTEAKLQGVHPFCLTIDRQAAAYLPGVFGAHQYALLPKPQLLPTVLLDWMKRLIAA